MDTTTQPTPEQMAELLKRMAADRARRERLLATGAGCSAWHVMTKGSVRR